MFDNILSNVFTSDVVNSMGDWYSCIYSWSTFACLCSYLIVGILSVCIIFKWVIKWLK